jgi:hypothetical protein
LSGPPDGKSSLFIVEKLALARVRRQNEVDGDTDERSDGAFEDDYTYMIG